MKKYIIEIVPRGDKQGDDPFEDFSDEMGEAMAHICFEGLIAHDWSADVRFVRREDTNSNIIVSD